MLIGDFGAADASTVCIPGCSVQVATLGFRVKRGDNVTLDGKPVNWSKHNEESSRSATTEHVYIKYWKPKGVVCTTDRTIKGNVIDEVRHANALSVKPTAQAVALASTHQSWGMHLSYQQSLVVWPWRRPGHKRLWPRRLQRQAAKSTSSMTKRSSASSCLRLYTRV